MSEAPSLEVVKKRAFAAVANVNVGAYNADRLRRDMAVITAGTGVNFNEGILKPFVDAVVTGDEAEIESTRTKLVEQTRDLMGAHQRPTGRGMGKFSDLSSREQENIAGNAQLYVDRIEAEASKFKVIEK